MSYYISPRFQDKLAVHITKNYLDLPNVRVPLILGIHGRKGEGKSFQCELVFEKMGVEVTLISGGELESPDAGDPARLIRLRYRETAELIKVRGKMCVLMINDLDAGAGRFDEGTQYTVNTQLVNATLMNIADNPTDVQLPGSYDSNPLHRVPIIVTGNDFSTLYAPLIRDGRMEKFYWEPNRDDKIGIVGGIFSEDGLSKQDIEKLVENFPTQAVDFYSALRSRIYDEQIRKFIHDTGIEKVSSRVVNSNNIPSFTKPKFSLSDLMDMAKFMVEEQKRVDDSHLVEEYNRGALRHQKYFIPQPAQTPVYEARPTANFDGEPLPTYHARPSYQAEAEAVEIPDIPSSPKLEKKGINSSIIKKIDITKNTQIPTTHVGPEILSYMQNILSSGNHLSIEYADKHQFSKGEWQRFSTHEIDDMADAIGDLERCLVDRANDYVRVAGIDYKTKQAVMATIIQNPNEKPNGSTFRYPPTPTRYSNEQSSDSSFRYPPTATPFPAPHTSASSYTATSHAPESRDYHTFRDGNPHNAQIPTVHLDPLILEQMREILASGNHIGIEYVDQRRFRIGSWKSFAGHQIEDMADAIAALEACLVEHNNDYVRIFAIEPQAKRRLSEIIIQRPNDTIVRK